MSGEQKLTHEFVEYVPRELKAGVVYVSIPFATVIHKCCCGCGQQVVTPLAPSQWTLSYDGKSVSLHPSIGNWNFPCRSHYWIRQNKVVWADQWSANRITATQQRDAAAVEHQFMADRKDVNPRDVVPSGKPAKPEGRLTRFRKKIFGK